MPRRMVKCLMAAKWSLILAYYEYVDTWVAYRISVSSTGGKGGREWVLQNRRKFLQADL